jgi:hypothetical protein
MKPATDELPGRTRTGKMVDLPQAFRTTAFSYYVWSRSRRAGHVLAYAIAKFADPTFRWMTIRELATEPSVEEGWVRRLIPESRIIPPFSDAEFVTEPQISKGTFDSLIRPNGAAADRAALDHFFLLPRRLQRVFDEYGAFPAPRFLVVANTNRVRQFYPTNPDRLRAYTDIFPRNGFSMITTSIPPPYEGRHGFGIVLRLNVDSAEEWRAADLVVEKGLPTGEFRTGATFSSKQIPWYLEAGAEIEKASV